MIKKLIFSLLVFTLLIGGAVFAEEPIIVDNAENPERLEKGWLISEGALNVEYTDEIAYEGDKSIKMSYKLNEDQRWATFHNSYFEHHVEGNLKAPGGTLKFRIFNPNPELEDKIYVRTTLMDNNSIWWWPPGLGVDYEKIDWEYEDEEGAPAGETLGWSGTVEDPDKGDGWFLYEIKLPEGKTVSIESFKVLQIKLNLSEEDQTTSIGPEGPTPNYIYIDNIEVIPAE